MASPRSTSWAFLVYPEDERLFAPSIPDARKREFLCSFLETLKVPCAVSPLHDADVWTDGDALLDASHVAGTQKKPHWHVVLRWDSLKSAAQVLALVEPLHVGHVERVESWRGYTRYLCHLDNPEKAAYDVNGVRAVMGYDLSPLYDAAAADARKVRREVLQLCDDYALQSIRQLCALLAELDKPDSYLDFVVARSHFIVQYLKS